MPAKPLPAPLDLLIQRQARLCSLPVDLVRAIVWVESGGDVHAWNPEPPYRYFWDVRRKTPFRSLTELERASEVPPDDFPSLKGDRDAEWWGQAASWGPMQVMGAVAREHGFSAHFPALCDALHGVQYGCVHLDRLRDRFLGKFGWQGVAAAYNAGSPRLDARGRYENQVYVDKIAATGGFGEETA